jgi:hypothetical protein
MIVTWRLRLLIFSGMGASPMFYEKEHGRGAPATSFSNDPFESFISGF